jgi:hypothetical protein
LAIGEFSPSKCCCLVRAVLCPFKCKFLNGNKERYDNFLLLCHVNLLLLTVSKPRLLFYPWPELLQLSPSNVCP